MGIKGLWQTVVESGERVSLRHVSNTHRIISGDKLRLGVDMGTFMGECAGIARSARSRNQILVKILQILFHKLAVLIKSPLILLFVYDGHRRPNRKRGRIVNTGSVPDWVEPSRALISYFGFNTHQAPGEAEAELSELNIRGFIDGVITSDSDALVFGARIVYRMIPRAKKLFEDDLFIFTSELIESEVKLARGDLLLFALLCGGDYDELGVKGCGPKLVQQLAVAGYGTRLAEMLQLAGSSQLTNAHFDGWRSSLKMELETNIGGHLRCRYPSVASQISPDFPNPAIVHMYANPLTSWSTVPSTPVNASTWVSSEPSTEALARICVRELEWNDIRRLNKRFMDYIWEGVLLQMLYSNSVSYDISRRILCSPKNQLKILNVQMKKRRGKFASVEAGGYCLQARISVDGSTLAARSLHVYTADGGNKFDAWAYSEILPDGMIGHFT